MNWLLTFPFEFLHFPIWITLLLLGVQALVFTYIGLTFEKYLRPYLGEAVEKVGGVILILLAGYLAAERWLLYLN